MRGKTSSDTTKKFPRCKAASNDPSHTHIYLYTAGINVVCKKQGAAKTLNLVCIYGYQREEQEEWGTGWFEAMYSSVSSTLITSVQEQQQQKSKNYYRAE